MFGKTNGDRKRRSPGSRMSYMAGSILLLVLAIGGSVFALMRLWSPGLPSPVRTMPPPKPAVSPVIKATEAPSSFSFTAAGDYGQTPYTTANLDYIAGGKVNFHLALGDFDYEIGRASCRERV